MKGDQAVLLRKAVLIHDLKKAGAHKEHPKLEKMDMKQLEKLAAEYERRRKVR
nr:hypothetical protein 22 [Bacillales bacterium]